MLAADITYLRQSDATTGKSPAGARAIEHGKIELENTSEQL